MEITLAITSFLIEILTRTFMQLISVIGIIFLLCVILHILERLTTRAIVKNFGWNGVLFTAWLGTPVHEFGHAFFCLPFKHKIIEMKFYEPDPDSGCLGYVSHIYNPNSIYQQIGNFFIGIGPLIIGSIALFSSLLILPNNSEIFTIIEQHSKAFSELSGIITNLDVLWVSTTSILEILWRPQNFYSIQFWIFFYIALCIASHISPSTTDMKGVLKGAIIMVGGLVLANAISLIFHSDISGFVLMVNDYTGLLVALLSFSVAISFANFIIVSFFMLAYETFIKRPLFK